MSGPILTAKHAADLNKLVQRLVDPRLYLLCNYEPTIRHAISEDGRYLLNIQDLYKFAIDSSGIIKQYRKIIPYDDQRQFYPLLQLLDQIGAFRTVFDHNISDNDGQISVNEMARYTTWVRSVIGKPNPETVDDYKTLNQGLSDMATKLLFFLEKFIRRASTIPDRKSVVSRWIDMTLYWYSNNTKTDIYKGNLIGAYIANSKAADTNTDDNYWLKGISRKVRRWIEDALPYPLQSKIDQTTLAIEEFNDILNGKNARFEKRRCELSSEQEKEIMENIRSALGEKRQELNQLQNELRLLEEKIGSDPIKYFYRNLEKQLRETMDCLEHDDISYTLLPQDLIQEDIARIFCDVPSPEGDF